MVEQGSCYLGSPFYGNSFIALKDLNFLQL